MFEKLKKYQFLFEELVQRDFKRKYKRTVLGMVWSVLSPLLTLFIMRLVFTHFFGMGINHYTTYLFCGNLVFSYFSEASGQGMSSLMDNAGIFTKVNVPKYLFLLSKNVQTLINFGLTLVVFFIFCVLDHITFTWKLIFLLYPIICLMLFNIGVGLILSAFYVFFRDMEYLWSVFLTLLMYSSFCVRRFVKSMKPFWLLYVICLLATAVIDRRPFVVYRADNWVRQLSLAFMDGFGIAHLMRAPTLDGSWWYSPFVFRVSRDYFVKSIGIGIALLDNLSFYPVFPLNRRKAFVEKKILMLWKFRARFVVKHNPAVDRAVAPPAAFDVCYKGRDRVLAAGYGGEDSRPVAHALASNLPRIAVSSFSRSR